MTAERSVPMLTRVIRPTCTINFSALVQETKGPWSSPGLNAARLVYEFNGKYNFKNIFDLGLGHLGLKQISNRFVTCLAPQTKDNLRG